MNRLIWMGLVAMMCLAPVGAFGEEDWKEKLKAEGWVWIDLSREQYTDITTYAAEGSSEYNKNAVGYIHPDGKKSTYQKIKGLETVVLTREITPDGKVCLQSDRYWNGKKYCRTWWKKGDLYMTVTDVGWRATIFTVKQGNAEGFKF